MGAATKPKPTTPQAPSLHARVVQVYEKATTVGVTIFGKTVFNEFKGENHEQNAVAWVAKWNEHLEREWMQVRATSAMIMEAFEAALLRVGVCQLTIDEAFAEVTANARE